MSDYYKIMAEPLPRSRDFGFEPPENWREDADALNAAVDAFKATEGYWLWEIAMSEWSIHREQAELDRQAEGEGAYAEWVKSNNPHAIAYEKQNIAKFEEELAKLRTC